MNQDGRATIRPMKLHSLVALTMLLAAVVPRHAAGQRVESAPSLRAGAAKVDVTPAPGELPKNSRGILDRLYARAIVLENGAVPLTVLERIVNESL